MYIDNGKFDDMKAAWESELSAITIENIKLSSTISSLGDKLQKFENNTYIHELTAKI